MNGIESDNLLSVASGAHNDESVRVGAVNVYHSYSYWSTSLWAPDSIRCIATLTDEALMSVHSCAFFSASCNLI